MSLIIWEQTGDSSSSFVDDSVAHNDSLGGGEPTPARQFTPVELKSREISFTHNLSFICEIVLQYFTQLGSISKRFDN